MNTLTKTTCPSRYTGLSHAVYECGLETGHESRHMDKCWPMTWPDLMADEPAAEPDRVLQEIRERVELDKAEFTSYPYDQSIRDREYLLSLLDGAK